MHACRRRPPLRKAGSTSGAHKKEDVVPHGTCGRSTAAVLVAGTRGATVHDDRRGPRCQRGDHRSCVGMGRSDDILLGLPSAEEGGQKKGSRRGSRWQGAEGAAGGGVQGSLRRQVDGLRHWHRGCLRLAEAVVQQATAPHGARRSLWSRRIAEEGGQEKVQKQPDIFCFVLILYVLFSFSMFCCCFDFICLVLILYVLLCFLKECRRRRTEEGQQKEKQVAGMPRCTKVVAVCVAAWRLGLPAATAARALSQMAGRSGPRAPSAIARRVAPRSTAGVPSSRMPWPLVACTH